MLKKDISNAVARYIVSNYDQSNIYEDILADANENTENFKYFDNFFDYLLEELKSNGLKNDFKNYNEYKTYVSQLEDETEDDYYQLENEVIEDFVIELMKSDYTQQGVYRFPYIIPDMYAGEYWENKLTDLPDDLDDEEVFEAFMKLGKGKSAFENAYYDYFYSFVFN